MRLDRTEPFDEVFGTPGVTFTQRGRLFNMSGHEVRLGHEHDDDGADVLVAESVPSNEPEPVVATTNEFAAMHWKTLKSLLDTYGEPYTTREAAIDYLSNRGG